MKGIGRRLLTTLVCAAVLCASMAVVAGAYNTHPRNLNVAYGINQGTYNMRYGINAARAQYCDCCQ